MSAVPERFDDNLAARIFPHRFRRVGNPYAFLNDVGIVPILEFIYKGNLLIDVAEALNVSYTILQTWAENEGHEAAIEEAQRISAEGYLAEGLKRLKRAQTDFELKQAKEMIAHARFMASKKDKTQYGSTEQTGVEKAGVSYVFNIAGSVAVQAPATATPQAQVIEHEPAPPLKVGMNLMEHIDKDFNTIFKNVPLPPEPPRKDKNGKVILPIVGPFHD